MPRPTRNHLRAFAALVVVCSLALVVSAFVTDANGAARSYPDTEGVAALTFDDGPDPRFTPLILDILAHHDAKATFFVIGEHAERYPELIARIIAEGHEIAHHTHSHPHVDRIDNEELTREMDACLEVLAAQGVEPVWYRPPRKQLTPAQEQAANTRGMRVAMWSRCMERARFKAAEDAALTLARETCAGDIVLAHDGLGDRGLTAEALPLYLGAMDARGIEMVTLTELDRRSKWWRFPAQ